MANNQVKFTLAMDGGDVVITTIDGVTHRFGAMGDSAKGAGEKASTGIDAIRQKLDQMQSTAMTVAKTLAGVFVVDKIVGMAKEMAMLNARYETLGVAMRVVGQNAGYTGAQMDMATTGMQAMGISMVESRQQAMRLVQAHIDLANSQKLARIAQDAAVIGNMNSSDAFAAMIHGISTGQTDVLRTIGLNVSMEQSYKAMADTLHKHQDELTQNERTQGVLNSVMKAGADIAGTYEAAMDTAGKQINSMKRYTEDLKTVQGEVFNEVLTVAVMAYTSHLKESNAEARALAANGELKAWGMELAQVFVGVANTIDNMLTGVKMVGNWAAQRSVAGDITEKYQQKLDALGNTPDVWKQRGDLVAKRDAEIKASLALLDEANVELGKRSDRFQNAFDTRQQAMADKATKEAAAVASREKFLTDTMAFYQDQRVKGMLKEADYVNTMNAFLLKNYGQGTPDYKDTTPAPKAQALTEYERLIKSINEKTAADKLDMETQGSLTAGQKEAIKIMEDLRDGTLKLTVEKKQKLTHDLEDRLNTEQAKIADEQATKQLVADAAARQAARAKEYDGINAYIEAQEVARNADVKASADSLKAAQAQYDQYGKSKDQIAEIIVKELELKKTRLRAYYEETDTSGELVRVYNRENEVLNIQIDNQRKLVGVLKDTEALDAQKSMWSSIEQTAHTTFTNIFQGGQDVFTKLRDVLKSTLLDLLYQMTVKKWIFNIAASVSGSGVANAAMPGMASNVGSLYNAGSAIATVGGQYFAGTMSGANAVGTLAANATTAGSGTALDALLASNGAYGTAVGSGAAAAGAAGAEAGAAAATAGAGAGASSILAAIPGWGWAALGAVALFSMFGGSGHYVASTGESGKNFDASGKNTSTDPYRYAVDNSGADKFVANLNATYLASAKSLGITAKDSRFFYGANDSDGGKYRIGAGVGGQDVFNSGEQKASDAALKLSASQAVLAALQGSELPKWMRGVFDGIDAAKLDQAGVDAAIKSAQDLKNAYDVLQTIPGTNLTGISFETLNSIKGTAAELAAVNTSFSSLGYTLLDVSVAGGAAASGLVAAMGGLQNFQAQMASYQQNYLTPAEQRANTVNSVVGDLAKVGIKFTADQVGGANRADIRAVVDAYAAKANTEEGARQYAAVVKAANALTAITPAMQDVTKKSALVPYSPEWYAQGLGGGSNGSSGGGYSGGVTYSGGASAGSSAVDQVKTALQQYTDAIVGEVKRIRGQMEGTGQEAYAAAQSRLSIAQTQAVAGSVEAYKSLPELSQAVNTLAESNVSSYLELQRVRARTAAGLESTGTLVAAHNGLTIPAFASGGSHAGGWAMVGERGPELAYMPPARIYTASDTRAMIGAGGASNGDLAAALRAWADQLEAIEANTASGALSAAKTARMLERVMPNADEDVIAVQVVVPKGGFLPVRAV